MPRLAPAFVVLGSLVVLIALERHYPLRQSIEPPERRDRRNLAVAAVTAVALRVAGRPIIGKLADLVERRRCGVLQHWRLPPPVEAILARVLMDYTLYLWHVLLHHLPLLWRCHIVHHADLDLSATTALRLHFSEMVMSVPWRAAQVLLLGVRSTILKAWQTATLATILFHHSNLRLPSRLERLIEYLIVTPRLHGVHHAAMREDTGSNWSSGLSLWDRLHGTLRLEALRETVTVGMPSYRDPRELTLPKILAMPFGEERPQGIPMRHSDTPAGGTGARARGLRFSRTDDNGSNLPARIGEP